MEQPQQPTVKHLFSYKYNINDSYYIKHVTGTFIELTNIDPNKRPSVVYIPSDEETHLDDHGGSKQKKTRRNRRKSNRRR